MDLRACDMDLRRGGPPHPDWAMLLQLQSVSSTQGRLDSWHGSDAWANPLRCKHVTSQSNIAHWRMGL